MNTQIERQSKATKPPTVDECVKFLPAPRTTRSPMPEMRPPAEPSEEVAYGCVEWFNYEKHPLRGRAA